MTETARHWLITGASSGLGAALARAALDSGDAVSGTVRNAEAAADFAALSPLARPVLLDVTDRGHVLETVKALDIDVLVNNAGYCLAGAVESLEVEDLRAQLEANVVGSFNLMQAVLPGMRRAGRGRVLNIGSLSGAMGMAGLGAYCASKFALAGLSDSVALEVRPFGIHVTLVEPSGFRTSFAGRSLRWGRRNADAYQDLHRRLEDGFERSNGHQRNAPAKGAEALIRLARMDNPPMRFALGYDAVDRLRTALDSRVKGYDASLPFGADTAFDG